MFTSDYFLQNLDENVVDENNVDETEETDGLVRKVLYI